MIRRHHQFIHTHTHSENSASFLKTDKLFEVEGESTQIQCRREYWYYYGDHNRDDLIVRLRGRNDER